MSTKKLIIMTIAVLLTLDILTVALLALFFPSTRTGYVRQEDIDTALLEKVLAAKTVQELTDYENLLRLQLELDKAPTFTMEKESSIKAEQAQNSYTTQNVRDKKEKINNKIEYQSIQLKGTGEGLAHTFSPKNAGTKVVFDLSTKTAEVRTAKTVINNTSCVWNVDAEFYKKNSDGNDSYIKAYGNWGNYMTDYFFASKEDIQNADDSTVQYNATTKMYTLTVVVNASATEHYKNKVLTLGNGSIQDVIFQNSCATITFAFDANWKVHSYTIEEDYQTKTKILFTIVTNTKATHQAKFYY